MKPALKSAAVFSLLALCVAARLGAQTTADDFCASGDAKEQKYDYDGALADYNKAIDLDAKCAQAYDSRSFIEICKGDFDSAIADSTRAIELAPGNPGAFYDRGVARDNKGDFDGAISDYAHAAKLSPDSALSYALLGAARQSKGDSAGALADMDRAVGLEPKNPIALLYRGVENMRLLKWADALPDLRAASAAPADASQLQNQDYAHFFIWVINTRLGEADGANKELAAFIPMRADGAAGDWFSKIGGFLLGSVTEADLISAAKVPDKPPHPDQFCQAYYYIGIKKLFAGDKKAAADYFHKSLDTKMHSATEYQLSGAELKALGE